MSYKSFTSLLHMFITRGHTTLKKVKWAYVSCRLFCFMCLFFSELVPSRSLLEIWQYTFFILCHITNMPSDVSVTVIVCAPPVPFALIITHQLRYSAATLNHLLHLAIGEFQNLICEICIATKPRLSVTCFNLFINKSFKELGRRRLGIKGWTYL